MKPLILSIALLSVLLSCKKETACNKQEENNKTVSIKVKKEDVMYPIRDPYADDFSEQYQSYLNKKNGGC